MLNFDRKYHRMDRMGKVNLINIYVRIADGKAESNHEPERFTQVAQA